MHFKKDKNVHNYEVRGEKRKDKGRSERKRNIDREKEIIIEVKREEKR